MAYLKNNGNTYDKHGAISTADDRRLELIIQVEEDNLTRAKKNQKDKVVIDYLEDEVRYLKELKERRKETKCRH